MAANINLFLKLEATTAGGYNYIEAGSKTIPLPFTITNGKFSDKWTTLAPTTTTTLFDSTAATGIGSFTFLYIYSDKDIMIELVTDQDNSVGTRTSTFKIPAGSAYVLTSNVSYANYTANFGGGTLDVIDLIRARNLSGVDTANIRVVLAN